MAPSVACVKIILTFCLLDGNQCRHFINHTSSHDDITVTKVARGADRQVSHDQFNHFECKPGKCQILRSYT